MLSLQTCERLFKYLKKRERESISVNVYNHSEAMRQGTSLSPTLQMNDWDRKVKIAFPGAFSKGRDILD